MLGNCVQEEFQHPSRDGGWQSPYNHHRVGMLGEDKNSAKQVPRLGKIGEEVLNGVSETLSMQRSTTLPPFYLAVRQQMYERTKTGLGRSHAECTKRRVRVFDMLLYRAVVLFYSCVFSLLSLLGPTFLHDNNTR